MNIPWKMKSAAFRSIDAFGFHGLLYFLQKHVTRRSKVSIRKVNPNWLIHEENLKNLPAPNVLEFGAGKNLAQNIYLSRQVRSQTVVDLFPMLDIAQFNQASSQVAALTGGQFKESPSTESIQKNYSIQYVAPLDVSESGFDDGAFDACISTNTLEHIPRDSIVKIFTELKRILRRGGLVSAVIDYSDHYAHTDRAISKLNFLSFSQSEFERHNHRVHYQNRMRHQDFEVLFRDLGFRIRRSEPLNPESLPAKISSEFDTAQPSLTATTGVFLLEVV